jgi:hypothetical protein
MNGLTFRLLRRQLLQAAATTIRLPLLGGSVVDDDCLLGKFDEPSFTAGSKRENGLSIALERIIIIHGEFQNDYLGFLLFRCCF